MDSGKARYTQSKFNGVYSVSERGLIINSERYVGFSYRFHKFNVGLSQYACASCRTLGKSRVVTVRNGIICGKKHPEDDHHKDCRPIADVELCNQSARESFSVTLTRDPVSDPSAHDPSVGHSKYDPSGDYKNTVEESNYS